MNPIDLNKSITTIISVIENFEKDSKADVLDVKSKVTEFVTNNQTLIPTAQQTEITDLLGRLSDAASKESACKELTALISSTAKIIQQQDTKQSSVDEEQTLLKQWILSIAKYNSILEEIQKFNFSEQFRIKLAKELSKNPIFNISEHIHKFNINDEMVLMEIVYTQLSHRHLRAALCKNIQNYGFSEEARYQIAQLIADRDRSDKLCEGILSKYIENFQLPYEKRLEIGKRAEPMDLCRNLASYKLSDKDRHQLAKLIIQSERIWYASFLLSSLKEFISLEQDRFEFIQSNVSLFPSEICMNISFLDLSEDHRFAIAIQVASFRDSNLGVGIKSFGITDEQRRIAVAKIAAKANGHKFLLYLGNYQIKNPTERERLIKIAASTTSVIQEQFLKLYNTEDQITIAKSAARQNGSRVINAIGSLNTKDESILIRIFLLALQSTPDDEIEKNFNSFNEALPKEATSTKSSPILEKWKKEQEELVKEKDPLIKRQVELWLKIFAFVCNKKKIPEKTLQKYLPCAEEILKYQDPAMRYNFLTVMIQHGVPEKEHGTGHNLLFNLLLTPLLQKSGITDEDAKAMHAALSRKDYEDSATKEKTLKGLHRLLDCDELSITQKGTILKNVFAGEIAQHKEKEAVALTEKTKTSKTEKEKTNKEATEKQKHAPEATPVHLSLQLLDAIISSGNSDMLFVESEQKKKESDQNHEQGERPIRHPLDLAVILNQCFTQTLGLDSVENFAEKYKETIGKARNPIALMIYAAKLKSLEPREREKAIKSLQEFTTAVLEGTYKSWRYQIPDDSHLAKLFKNNAALLEVWRKGEKLTLDELLKKTPEEQAKSGAIAAATAVSTKESATKEYPVGNYLRDRICVDKHLDPALCPSLAKFLTNPGNYKTVVTTLQEATKKEKLPDKKVQYSSTDTNTKAIFHRNLELALFCLLDPAKPSIRKARDIDQFVLPVLKKVSGEDSEIVRDMINLQKLLRAEVDEAFAKQNYAIEDTNHWEDLLLSGTDVIGSCQRISGDVYYNKCLLAYMQDGKNRAIVIKDKSGKIQARSIMRLLWDETLNKAVLFQERLYHNPGVSDEALKAINLMFSRRAKELKVPLVCTGNDNKRSYPNSLKSLGSPAPFEYVDAGPGVTDGIFTIPNNTIQLVQE